MKRFFPTAAALCSLVVSAHAANGVVVSMKTTSGASTTTDQIQLDANHMRAQVAGRGGSQNGVIFDGTKQTMYIIDDNKKTYSEITKDDLDRLAAQMKQMQSQMQGAMAQLTPEQRAQMQAAMGGRAVPGMAAAAAPPKPTFKKTGSDRVGKWTCDKYEGYEGTRKTTEVCTIPSSALGLTDADFAVSKDFAKFVSTLAPQSSTHVFSLATIENQGYAGLPIRTITYAADGSVQSTMELTDVSHQNIPDSTFVPPSGYAKQDMFGARGRRGGN